ncbi:N-acetylglucosamine-6-phosphate deacetylase [Clostridium sp.]|uniref:N-acetylglucosamine-6-phosphate deacetylase n=1 Tax=Clostridium sp. TaxID=1506 RepID=UPI001A636DD5|nr:N-acetylglucosamine-6-phosphate deacetylase [Clostridium sp.]MBK5240045.1 N-acetylglucosamine-6-phosphate deacetylase [Clostridium sp.]
MKIIINGKILIKDEVVYEKSLLFDEKILEFVEAEDLEKLLPRCDEIIDAKGNFVSPGFIDIHVHGSGGYDVMDGTEEALSVISSVLAQNGVTGFLPTTMTMSEEKIYAALDNIRIQMKKKINGSKILGAHMEGPFINKKYKGAQKEDFIIKPNFKFIEDYIDVIKLITLAPEEDDNFDFIKEIVKRTNIILSIGHSNADYEETMEAIKCGISHATHTFNAMTPLNHRKPGIVGAILNSDIYCELIADGIHVHPAIFNILKKLKGTDRIILITDSMRAGCLKDGVSELGGQKVIVKNNSARLEDGTLAGSILKLNEGVKNFMNNSDIDICEAISLVSINPARELGLDKVKGSLEVGKYADIVILDSNFNVQQTIVEGNTVFKSNEMKRCL